MTGVGRSKIFVLAAFAFLGGQGLNEFFCFCFRMGRGGGEGGGGGQSIKGCINGSNKEEENKKKKIKAHFRTSIWSNAKMRLRMRDSIHPNHKRWSSALAAAMSTCW